MSIKQTAIVTAMILFLGTTLFSAGAWFHYSAELDAKKKTIDVLENRKIALDRVLNKPDTGEKAAVDHPIGGLKKKLADVTAQAVNMLGDESRGTVQRQQLYEQKAKELEGKLPGAQTKWKSLYEDWLKLNGDIDGAVKKLKAQVAEAETKVTEAQAELDRELGTETTEKKKIVEKRKEYADDIGQIRATHEQVLDKVSEVTRETRKEKTIAPQGRVIGAAEDLQLVTVDVGRDQGLRKGLRFDVYSNALGGRVKKAVIEITTVRASSSDAVIVTARRAATQDPQTGWVPNDPRMRFSVFAAGGPDETGALELVRPKTREERIETYRLEKLEREMGSEAKEAYLKSKEAPLAPPSELGKGFVPLMPGDWINNPEFVPIIPETAYQKKTVDELLGMEDVNLSTLTFTFTDSVRAYRREFLKRLCERNRCKTADAVSADVNYVVTAAGATRPDLLEEKLQSSKDKKDEEVSAEIKAQRKTLAALLEARKSGAQVMGEDEVEGFFARRQRKAELLRGKTVQPGRSTFFVAGETQERSVAQTLLYIKDHGGVPAQELGAGVDYVVVGAGLDQAFFDKVKKLGLKIIREDELPRFFGLE